jgi:hypothetical protein
LAGGSNHGTLHQQGIQPHMNDKWQEQFASKQADPAMHYPQGCYAPLYCVFLCSRVAHSHCTFSLTH